MLKVGDKIRLLRYIDEDFETGKEVRIMDSSILGFDAITRIDTMLTLMLHENELSTWAEGIDYEIIGKEVRCK